MTTKWKATCHKCKRTIIYITAMPKRKPKMVCTECNKQLLSPCRSNPVKNRKMTSAQELY